MLTRSSSHARLFCQVFYMFDRLLLLRRGGQTTYFDDIGQNGNKLVNYLTRVSNNMLPYSELESPANWMLNLISLDASALIEEQKAEAAGGEDAAVEAAKGQPDVLEQGTGVANAAIYHKDDAEKEPFTHGEKKPDPKSLQAGAASPNSQNTNPLIHSASVQTMFRSKLLAATRSSAGGKSFHGGEDELAVAQPIEFAVQWSHSQECADAMKVVDQYSSEKHAAGLHSSPSKAGESKIQYIGDTARLLSVIQRGFVSHWRSPPVNVTRFMLMFIIGLFMGLVYQNVSVFDFAGLSSLLAAVFLGVSIPSSICSTASLSTFFRQRSVYYRESSVKMYGYKTCTSFTDTLL